MKTHRYFHLYARYSSGEYCQLTRYPLRHAQALVLRSKFARPGNADSPEQAMEKAIAAHPEEARMVLRVYLLTCCIDRT